MLDAFPGVCKHQFIASATSIKKSSGIGRWTSRSACSTTASMRRPWTSRCPSMFAAPMGRAPLETRTCAGTRRLVA
jgi:hypothetical protein